MGRYPRDHEARPMWGCPSCGRTFAARNQTHTCRALGNLDRHFDRCDTHVRVTFDRVLAAMDAIGSYDVLPELTRIALHRRMSFAALIPKRRWLDGHVVLARTIASVRFRRVDAYSPRNVVHAFRLSGPADVDTEFGAWLAEAYAVGEQRHLGR